MRDMTLTEFLLARIAEDEESPRLAAEGLGWLDHKPTGVTIRGVVAYEPTRVLAECEAKRRIVELHTAKHPDYDGERACVACQWDVDCDMPAVNAAYPCPTLRLLALPYADHPDYREEWRP